MATVPGFGKDFVGGHSDFLDLVDEGRLSFQGKADGESAFEALKDFLEMSYRSVCAELSSCWEPFCGRAVAYGRNRDGERCRGHPSRCPPLAGSSG
jgi:hypothetical protein